MTKFANKHNLKFYKFTFIVCSIHSLVIIKTQFEKRCHLELQNIKDFTATRTVANCQNSEKLQ